MKSGTRNQKTETRNKRALKRAIQNLGIWVIVSIVISTIFCVLGEATTEDIRRFNEPDSLNWGQVLSIVITILLFNLFAADILRHFIKEHARNVVAWTTAIIVFTPFISAIFYFLTWPKNQKITTLIE